MVWHCECCKDGLNEWSWKMVQCGKRLSYAIVPFHLSFLWNFFFKKDLAAKQHFKTSFLTWLECLDVSLAAVCVTVWTLCSKCHAFEHKLGTGSALLVHMGALIFQCLETVQSCQRRRFANQNSRWLKDTHTLTFTTALGMLQQPEMTFQSCSHCLSSLRVLVGILCLWTKHLFDMYFSERREESSLIQQGFQIPFPDYYSGFIQLCGLQIKS